MSKTFNVKTITFTAICIALAVVLSRVKLFSMPAGGSVTLCSMFFISLAEYLFGPVVGITAGVASGLIKLVLGGDMFHPVQVLLDYPLAFGAIGLSGFFKDKKNGLIKGYLLGVSGRFVMSFISGIVFFYNLLAEPLNSLWGSAAYNFPYMAIEAALTIAILLIKPLRDAVERIKKMI